ncbi:MAG: hypothetical protein HC906_12775 [Bacteroidales bacterium]|nr:hypothetical protein [Bacteroidales bacterium]
MKRTLLSLWIAFIFGSLYGQQTGSVIMENIQAPSLTKNIIGEPEFQPLAVYLPPSYFNNPAKKYPVIYFLPGYEDTIAAYTKGYINGYFSKINEFKYNSRPVKGSNYGYC